MKCYDEEQRAARSPALHHFDGGVPSPDPQVSLLSTANCNHPLALETNFDEKGSFWVIPSPDPQVTRLHFTRWVLQTSPFICEVLNKTYCKDIFLTDGGIPSPDPGCHASSWNCLRGLEPRV
jgi:hypothetical protein